MRKLRVWRRRVDAKLSAEQILAAHTVYASGRSLRELAALGWQAWGFASPDAAQRSLRHAFNLAGLPTRTFQQALAVKPRERRERHRPGEWHAERRCQGTVTNYPRIGQPCSRRVPRGVRYCAKHDPHQKAETEALAQRARAARGETMRADLVV